MKKVLVVEDNRDNLRLITYAMAGDVDQVLSAGCTGYFEKPFAPLTIMEKIHAPLDQTGTDAAGNKEHP